MYSLVADADADVDSLSMYKFSYSLYSDEHCSWLEIPYYSDNFKVIYSWK